MKWGELITMQQEQLRLLTQLMKRHESADGKHRRLAVRIPVHKLGQPKVKLAMTEGKKVSAYFRQ
jgi:hypothetical protein